MHPRISDASAVGPYRLALSFTDGTTGVADLSELLDGHRGMLEPLHDRSFFARVFVNAEAGTVQWPNGVDLDPDVLYELAHGAAA